MFPIVDATTSQARNPTPTSTYVSTSTDTIFRVSQGINGYARGITTSTSQKSLVTVLQQTPVSGNMLILTYGTYKGGAITSVTQTGVTWTLQKATVAYGVMDIEIWAGVVGNGASTSITVSWTYAASGGAVVDVCEYSGLLTSNFLDKTASASGNSATLATGTTALTSQAEELFVGAIFTSNSIPNQGKATNGFTLLDGVHYALGIDGSLGYLEKISSVAETPSSTVTASSTFWGGCIATFKASSSISPSPTPTPTLTPTSTPTPTSSPIPTPSATPRPTTSTDTIFRVSQGINGYARGITTSTSQKSLVTVLQQTPVSGNMLILTYGTYKGGAITSVTQTGVTWTLQKATVAYGVMDIEIWAGVVGNGASTSITVSWTYAASGGAVVDVCEYSGLLTSNFLDKTASASGNSATLATGTTALTSQAEELFVGAIFTSNSIPNQGKATNGFTLLDGVHYALGIDGSLGYLEKISSVAETASSTVTASSTFWGGCIATFKASSSISPSPTPTPTLTPTSTPTPTSSPIPTPSATPRPTTSTDTIFRVSQGINGYARGITTSTSQKSLVTVLQQTPVSGNMLILTYGTYKGGAITSVTQTGVTWTLQKATVAYGVMDIEIWAGVVGNGASTSITVSWTYAASGGAVVDVCEYSGLLTSNFLDKTASASGNSATLATGTTALTSQAEELFVGAIFTSNSIPNQGKATNGFTLLDGVHYALGIDGSLGYLEKISSVAETASSTVTASSTFWGGCIATFKASSSISPSPTPTPTLTPTSTPTPRPTSSPAPIPTATSTPTPTLSPTPPPTQTPYGGTSKYNNNAVWLGEANDPIGTNLQGLISTLTANHIKYAVIMVGYWNAANPAAPTINPHFHPYHTTHPFAPHLKMLELCR